MLGAVPRQAASQALSPLGRGRADEFNGELWLWALIGVRDAPLCVTDCLSSPSLSFPIRSLQRMPVPGTLTLGGRPTPSSQTRSGQFFYPGPLPLCRLPWAGAPETEVGCPAGGSCLDPAGPLRAPGHELSGGRSPGFLASSMVTWEDWRGGGPGPRRDRGTEAIPAGWRKEGHSPHSRRQDPAPSLECSCPSPRGTQGNRWGTTVFELGHGECKQGE